MSSRDDNAGPTSRSTSIVHACTDEATLSEGVVAAVEAIRHGGLVVMPTDTVYGIGCDAFDASAVSALLAAKGRDRQVPPPVLVPGPATVDGLATEVPAYARALIDAFWPGPLTLVLRAQASLLWDIGETHGTVALRMPDHPVALAVLRAVGPMAVTSANRTGQVAATTAADAQDQLGMAVAVYLDAGPSSASAEALPSTILDCTGAEPRVLRAGALSQEAVDGVVAELVAAAAAAQADERRAYDEALTAAERARRREEASRARAADPRRNAPRIAGARRRS